MILAAIDIGSNAARLLITEVIESEKKPLFEKLNLVRVPLRLGFDVFDKKEISEIKTTMLLNTIRSFKYLHGCIPGYSFQGRSHFCHAGCQQWPADYRNRR